MFMIFNSYILPTIASPISKDLLYLTFIPPVVLKTYLFTGVLSTPQSTIGQAQNQNNKGIGTSTPTTQTCGATILAAPQITLSSQGQLVTNTGQILTTQPSQGSVITSPTMSQAVLSHLQAMATLQHNLPLAQTFTQSPNILPNQPLYIRATMPIHQAQVKLLSHDKTCLIYVPYDFISCV